MNHIPMHHAPTTTARRYAPAAYRHHTIIGTPQQVANVLANHHTAGTLAAATAPRPAPGRQVWVRLIIRETPPAAVAMSTRRSGDRMRPPGRTAALIAAITASVVGALAAVAYLAGQLVEWATAHAAVLAGLAVLAALITAALRGTAGRGKRHCPGC
jgi:hypothetical protein